MSCRRVYRPAFLLILLLAAALRFHRLDAQSLWNDEGNTARLVERPVPLIVEGAAGDIHPPGYYLLLHLWRAATGASEFALRSFSALCGLLTAAVIAALGRRAGGRCTALGAALIVAVHPLAVYYSQEARMYALLGLAAAQTVWAAARLTDGERGSLPLLALSITLGLYTQYAYIFALTGLNLAFGLRWLARRPLAWPTLRRWVGAHLLGGLSFLPWLPIALNARGWRPPDIGRGDALLAMGRALTVGLTLPPEAGHHALWLLLGLGGLALLSRPWRRWASWLALGAALTPPLLIALLGLYRPAYLKFLLVSLPPLAVLLALPLGRGLIRSGTSLLALAALLSVQTQALHHLYTDPAYTRDDYRSIAAQLTAAGRQGDAILLNAPNQWEVFTYYYHGPLPVYPAPYRPTAEEAEQWVTQITARHRRLFVLYWGETESDPSRWIEAALVRHAYPADDRWVTRVRVALYGTGPLPDAPTAPTTATFGSAVRLGGVGLPRRTFAAGDVIPVTLFWQALAPPGERLIVFVHLLNEAGDLVAQHDGEPMAGLLPTTLWGARETVTDRHGIPLPTGLPSGRYTIRVGMYRLSGERLIYQQGGKTGDNLPVGEVEITP